MSEAYIDVREPAKPLIGGDSEARRFTRRLPHLFATVFRVWEALVFVASGGIAANMAAAAARPLDRAVMAHDLAFVGVTAAFCLHFAGAYQLQSFTRPFSGLRSLFLAFGALLLIVSGCHLVSGEFPEFGDRFGLYWLALSVFFIVTARLLALFMITSRIRAGLMRETVAIVGGGARGERLVDYILDECGGGVEIIGMFDDRDGDRIQTQWKNRQRRVPTGTIDELLTMCKEKRVTRIIVAFPLSAEDRLHQVFKKLKSLSIDIMLCPDNIGFSLLNLNVGVIGNLPLLKVADAPFSGFSYYTKLLEDKILASIAVLMLSPIMLLAAIAIRLESPGPILFRQQRYGVNHKPFEVYKFRSMYWQQADHLAARQVTRTDSRVTRVGRILRKTSIDELPQLFNVLEGTMSMVGPRPHAVGMRTANLLCEEIVETYEQRHRVKPGITGWAQVNGSRGPTDTPRQLVRRVELDLYYIENWSVYLDIKILILTVLKLFNDEMAF